jgi:hypothetical protein
MLGMKAAIEAIHASSDDIAKSSKPSTASRSRPTFCAELEEDVLNIAPSMLAG